MLTLGILLLCASSAWASPNARIIGGIGATAGQFPFIAAITVNKAGGSYFCGGALIDNWWVLTAGQCVDGAVLFTIELGTNSLESSDSNVLKVATDTYALHPEFNPLTLENDVGLIKFRERITFTDYVRKIGYLATATLQDYATVATMGWGQTSDDTTGPVDKLSYVFLVTVSNNECKLTFGNQISDGMVCAAGTYNQGICLGDTGSPLIQYVQNGAAYHVGISSFVSGNGCESPDPSGFTRTHVYVDWIKNVTGIY